ncbi:NACHT domain-containing protein [Thermostaphylospora chromogena]|uniref:NACHT domain-containing protein n=1 Tax=Thermostaphylospora chromogena TaxID=35622 RepID=A0A1H1C907_9ACTN|nr:NACHT domain-containing protein [Thermostaphylospora chromogena]SDQ60673.1 NACHT domain-containing protein [Thermostaphylospora chromogena]
MNRRWLPVLWAVLGLLSLVAMVVMVARAISFDESPNIADLVAVTLAAIPLLVSLVAWTRRSAQPQTARAEVVERAKEVLAERVREQWRNEAILRSLDDPAPIPVRWTVTDDAKIMDHPDNLTRASLHLTGSSDDVASLAERFRAMQRRRLVILGDPGSGKTTLAVQLVRELLDSRAEHPGEAVPVLLSVAGWDTSRLPRLHEWVAEQLAQGYPALRAAEFGPDMPRRLAVGGHILPVLDGLDELPASAQAAVITALNRFLSRDDQVILTCRTSEYADAVSQAGDVLTSALVIQAHPVDRQAAAAYLRRCLPPQPGDAWERILTGLVTTTPQSRSLTALADVCATPLGLWLVRTVYANTRADVSPLLDPDAFPSAAALRADLLDHLIEALVTTREPSTDRTELFRPRRRHDPARVRKWLGYLAHVMTRPPDGSRPTRDFAWWRLARTTALFSTTAVWFGIVFGLVGGLIFVPWIRTKEGVIANVGGGLLLGVYCGVLLLFMVNPWQEQDPGFADLRMRGRGSSLARALGHRIAVGLRGGLVFGFVFGLVSTLFLEDVGGIEDQLFDFGFIFGLALGLGGRLREVRLKNKFESTGIDLESGKPRRAVLIAEFALGCLGGLMAGYWLTFEFMGGFAVGFVVGIMDEIVKWMESPADAEQATTPMTSWRADRAMNLLRITVVGCVGGFLGGFFSRLGEPVGGLMVGGFLGLMSGFVLGRHHAWLAYLITTYRLAYAGLLPRALMPFLDDAHRLGLLRAVGPIYQFRHAELQDHLAAVYGREYLNAKQPGGLLGRIRR